MASKEAKVGVPVGHPAVIKFGFVDFKDAGTKKLLALTSRVLGLGTQVLGLDTPRPWPCDLCPWVRSPC